MELVADCRGAQTKSWHSSVRPQLGCAPLGGKRHFVSFPSKRHSRPRSLLPCFFSCVDHRRARWIQSALRSGETLTVTVGGHACSFSTDNVNYHVEYLKGAKERHNLSFGYMGIWNEMPYKADYVEKLRAAMDTAGFQDTQIVASDSDGGQAVLQLEVNLSFPRHRIVSCPW